MNAEEHPHEPRWIDIGANLTSGQFVDDLDEVIERANAAAVPRMIVTGTSAEATAGAIAIAEAHQGLWATAGIHPHHASDAGHGAIAALESAAGHAKVVAIGECGLDFNRNYSPREDQLAAFTAQLQLAARTGLPLFLHQRDAHDTFLSMLHEAWPDLGGGAVVHCFTEGPAEAADYLELGCHIGITGWVCDERRGDALRAAVPTIPSERLMLETDAPYLLPRTIDPRPRTRRNEPKNMRYVGETVAQLRSEPLEKTARHAWETTCRFFGLPDG